MGESLVRGVMSSLLYGVVFFLIIVFIVLHLSWPIKAVGSVVKAHQEARADSSDAKEVVQSFPSYLGKWGVVTFLNGVLVVVAVVFVLLIRASVRRG